MTRPFVTLDVFTHHQLAGNPLAVVLESSGLDQARMQAIAREFNLSETVFVLPPADASSRARIKIFTPARELPFAGHPTVGTAVLLALMDGQDGDFVLEEEVGPVACRATRTAEGAGDAVFLLPRLPQAVGVSGSPSDIAASLSLNVADIGAMHGSHSPPARYSAGVDYHIVPLASREAVDRALPNSALWASAFGEGSQAAYLVAFDPLDPAHHIHARMFSFGFGMGEDPATGSAAAALAGYLVDHLRPGDGEHRFVIEQGYRMGRPSQIALTLHIDSGALHKAEIGGGAIVVSRGTLSV